MCDTNTILTVSINTPYSRWILRLLFAIRLYVHVHTGCILPVAGMPAAFYNDYSLMNFSITECSKFVLYVIRNNLTAGEVRDRWLVHVSASRPEPVLLVQQLKLRSLLDVCGCESDSWYVSLVLLWHHLLVSALIQPVY